jgi:hypothetical protein
VSALTALAVVSATTPSTRSVIPPPIEFSMLNVCGVPHLRSIPDWLSFASTRRSALPSSTRSGPPAAPAAPTPAPSAELLIPTTPYVSPVVSDRLPLIAVLAEGTDSRPCSTTAGRLPAADPSVPGTSRLPISKSIAATCARPWPTYRRSTLNASSSSLAGDVAEIVKNLLYDHSPVSTTSPRSSRNTARTNQT